MTTTELATYDAPTELSLLGGGFRPLMEIAGVLANSKLLPEHFQGKPADVLIGLTLAQQLGINPIMALQSMYVVGGRLGLSAQLMIGLANRSGMSIKWRVQRRDGTIEAKYQAWHPTERGKKIELTRQIPRLTVTAYDAKGSADDAVTVTSEMAAEEGWVSNAKYATLTEQMLRYRSATLLVRLYRPDVLLGLPTDVEDEPREVVHVEAVPVPSTPTAPQSSLDALRAAASAAAVSEGAAHPGAPATVAAPADDPDAEEKRRIVSWLGEQSRASEHGKRAVVEALAPTLAKDVGRLGLERLRAVAVAVRQALAPQQPPQVTPSPDRQRLADLLGSESWPLDATPELAAHLGVQRVDVAALTDEQVESALRWVDSATGGV